MGSRTQDVVLVKLTGGRVWLPEELTVVHMQSCPAKPWKLLVLMSLTDISRLFNAWRCVAGRFCVCVDDVEAVHLRVSTNPQLGHIISALHTGPLAGGKRTRILLKKSCKISVVNDSCICMWHVIVCLKTSTALRIVECNFPCCTGCCVRH